MIHRMIAVITRPMGRACRAGAIVLASGMMLAPATRAQSVPRGAPREAARGTAPRAAPTPTHVADTTGPMARPVSSAQDVRPEGHEDRVSAGARVAAEGRAVSFPFGHAEPVVTCAVLRVCIIALEPGEMVVSKPLAGDTVRWIITRSAAGPDGHTTLVAVKPTDCDVTTNLVVPTDRRVYGLTLDAPPCPSGGTNPRAPYTWRVSFTYPDDRPDQWTAPAAGPATTSTASSASGVALSTPLETLHFGYRITKEKGVAWIPEAVFDDGAHVYLKLPASARHAEAPALFVLEADGSTTLLNYTVSDDCYITDRLFTRAVLVSSAGGKARRVTIERTGED